MYGLLALFFMMHTLHASFLPPQDQLTEDEIKKRFAPWNKKPCGVSRTNRDEILDNHFKLVPARQGFIKSIALILKNRKVMKFYGTGRPIGLKEVEGRVTRLEQQLYSEPDPTSRMWAIMTHKGVCGVLLFYPSRFSSTTQQVSEIGRILSFSEQGKGLGSDVLNALFNYFPHMAWSGKSHPGNFASRKSRANMGFVHVETTYDEQDLAIRIFDRRDSNNKIDSNTEIRFSYSGNTVSLASLEREYTQRCLRET